LLVIVWVSADERRAQTVAGTETEGEVAWAVDITPGASNIVVPKIKEPSVDVMALRGVEKTRMNEPFAVGEENSRRH